MARLLLLIPTTSYRTSDFVNAAHELGVEVVVGTNQPQVLETYGGALRIDFRDLEKGVSEIVACAGERPFDGIVGIDDETVALAASAAQALGLPHNPPDSIAAARNKYRLRTVLANAAPRSPEFRLLSVADDPARAARDATFPCVLKPLALAASRGVIRADDAAGFVAAFRRIARILVEPDVAPLGDLARHILVERYIPGVEVALEGLLDRGRLHVLALFDKPDPLEGPFFEETIYVTPSRLADAVQREIAEAASQAIAAIGLGEGPVHAELRVNEAGPWLIEIAPRSIGGLCSRVLRFGAGISLEELIVRHALGWPIDSLERERRPAGVMMIPIPRAGVLREVRGLDGAKAAPGIEDIRITIPLGHEVRPLPEGNKYLGFMFARHESPEAVEAALREAHRRLEFVIEPPDQA